MRRGFEDSPLENSSDYLHDFDSFCLMLYNDDVNSYDYIIESLIEVCRHDPIQAEQCTFIAHHKGKCDVKRGAYNLLEPMKHEFDRRGISSVICEN